MSDNIQNNDQTPDNEEGMVSGEILTEIVENQLENNYPLKVKETLMRLRMTGVEREEAVMYIGCALAVELVDVAENGNPFDEKRYTTNLELLPEMPWAEE